LSTQYLSQMGLFLIIFYILSKIDSVNLYSTNLKMTTVKCKLLSKVFFALSLILLWCFCCVYGEDIYQSKINLDNFDTANAENTIKDLQKSIDSITQQLYELDDKEIKVDGDLTEKYMEIRKEIVAVVQDINMTTDTVAEMIKKINSYKKQIYANTKSLNETRSWIDSSKEFIEDFSNFLYKLSNNIEIDNKVDEFKLFALSDNIPVSISNEEAVKLLLLEFNKMLETLDTNQERQMQLILRLNQLKLNASAEVKSYQSILDTLYQKKNYLVQFMEIYKEDQLAEQTFSIIFNSRNDVYNAMMSMVERIVKKSFEDLTFDIEEKQEELDEAYENTMAGSGNLQPLAWPVYPIQNIETYFGDEDFEKEYGIPSRWISIAVEQWTPVYSAADGIVYHVTDNPWIWISWVLVMHENGFVTVYMYLNNIVVKKWDVLRRWQLIWHSWWEPGTKWAGFTSNGPNLTFIVFKNGVALDPLQFLDLSVIENKWIIPDEYNIKYLNDKYSRTIDISEVTFASGDTLDERAANFLRTYGVWAYKQLAFWEDAVAGTNIDRDVVICIAFAESTLGRYLTTSNNIWNVWNDDRWNRVSFNSALAWARSISNTLNNFYLWNYHTIRQLSRYGNVDGKIYASSPINWQRNVTKCLSQIKWYYVPEDYPFRTDLNPVQTWEATWSGETMTYVRKVD